MRVGDAYLLSPYFTYKETIITSAGGSQLLFSSNSQRIFFLATCVNAQQVYISMKSPTATNQGIPIPSNLPPFVCDYNSFPGLAGQAWFLWASISNVIYLLEGFEHPKPDA